MGGYYVLRSGHSLLLGLDILRSAHCREFLRPFVIIILSYNVDYDVANAVDN